MTRKNVTVRTALLGALALLPLLAACDSTSSDEDAQIQIQITDAPADLIASAKVWISRVYLQGGPHDDDQNDAENDTPNGRVDLFNDPAHPFSADLLVLAGGVTANLSTPVTIEAGEYKGLRIVVDSAFVTLKTGFTFAGGATTKSLKIPSGTIKVHLDSPIEAAEGQTTTLVVDFDVNQSFVLQGPQPPAAGGTVQNLMLLPVIKEKMRAEAETD